MDHEIETARLRLRPFENEDADAAHSWFGDPEVMRYTPSGPDVSPEQTRQRLAAYRDHQAQHGFSKWVITTAAGAPIGDAGLLRLDALGEVELGFRLGRAHWGKGLATEVALAWVRAVRELLSLERVVAFAHPLNIGSHRVLEKAGFQLERHDVVLGMPAMLFALSRPPG